MRFVRNSIFAAIMATSLALNAGLLVGDIVGSSIRAALEGVSVAVYLANQISDLKQAKYMLEKDLQQQRNVSKKLEKDLKSKNAQLEESERKRKKQKADFKKIHSKAKRRLAKIALVNVGAVGGEIVPLLGIPIIIGTTLYEVAESCKLAQDLANMARVMEIETSSKEEDEVCGLEVPFRDKGGKDAKKHKEKLERENKVD